jgi:hypothetical protein
MLIRLPHATLSLLDLLHFELERGQPGIEKDLKNDCLSTLNLPFVNLWRKAYAPHQIFKAQIGAQRIKAGIYLEVRESLAMHFIRFL